MRPGLRPDQRVEVLTPPPGGFPAILRSHLGFCLYKCALRLRGMMDQTLSEYGLISPQFGIMTLLSTEESLSQNDIGQRMGVDKATMVKLIDGLESQGFVKRTPHGEDRRVRLVSLTASGRTAFTKIVSQSRAVELEFTSRLSKDELDTLRNLTGRLLE